MSTKREDIIIIGNGIAGITAALEIRKRTAHRILVISSETPYFFSRTALMYAFMGQLTRIQMEPYERAFWETKQIELIQDQVTSIDGDKKRISTRNASSFNFDRLLIATGSKPSFFGWKGQELEGVRGLYSMQDLDFWERKSGDLKQVVIVGGGLIGVELAEMLLSRGIKVHFLIREAYFWAKVLPESDAELVVDHLKKYKGLKLIFNDTIKEICGDANGKVSRVLTDGGLSIDAGAVGIATGVQANIDFLNGSGIETKQGILVDSFLETNVKDVFAIGDCAELREPETGRRAIEQVWSTGKMMGQSVAKTICESPTPYKPGIWFNSAKFFELEYQTYGIVEAIKPEHIATFIWRHPDKEILLHFDFEKQGEKLLGVNAFGIRLRQELVQNWIRNGRCMDEILPDLKSANFNQEFFAPFEKDVLRAYNKQFDKSLSLNKKVWWKKLIE